MGNSSRRMTIKKVPRKGGHKTGMNVLYSNWNVQFVQFDKLQPFLNQMKTYWVNNGATPNGVTAAYMYAIWKKLDAM